MKPRVPSAEKALAGNPEGKSVPPLQDGAVTRLFLLSPAHCGGLRAQMLLNPRAPFDLAQRLRRGDTTLGEVFTFLSGLYFLGKLAYSAAFARPPEGMAGSWVITTNRGLLPASLKLDDAALRAFAEEDIHTGNPAYRRPLQDTARRLNLAAPGSEVILLGSIATGKYVDILGGVFGERLLFPEDFIGRGDMSRGGLLLRSVRAGQELAYRTVLGSARTGKRPPRLPAFSDRREGKKSAAG